MTSERARASSPISSMSSGSVGERIMAGCGEPALSDLPLPNFDRHPSRVESSQLRVQGRTGRCATDAVRLQELAREKEVHDLCHRISLARPPFMPPPPRPAHSMLPREGETRRSRAIVNSLALSGFVRRPLSAHRWRRPSLSHFRSDPNARVAHEFHGTNPCERTGSPAEDDNDRCRSGRAEE